MESKQILFNGTTPEQFSEDLLRRLDERLKGLLTEPTENKIKLLTRRETADLLSISMPTLHEWCKKKILNPYRMGNRVYFKSNEVENSLNQINL